MKYLPTIILTIFLFSISAFAVDITVNRTTDEKTLNNPPRICEVSDITEVIICGRVTTTKERGIFRALITFTDSRGQKKIVFTNSFGYFRFTDLTIDETYLVTVSHPRYTFPLQFQVTANGISTLGSIGFPK